MCNCTHGMTEAPDGSSEFCVQCVEGCDLELGRMAIALQDLYTKIHEYEVKGRRANLHDWEAVDLRGLEHSHAFLAQEHDKIEARRREMIEYHEHTYDDIEEGLYDTAQAALDGHYEPVGA